MLGLTPLLGSGPHTAAGQGQAIKQAQFYPTHLTDKSLSEVRYLCDPLVSEAWRDTAF